MSRPFKPVYQLDAMDCGPACLCMIARHYGKQIRLQRIREQALMTKQGVSLYGLSEAAESIGLRTKALRLDFNALTKLPLPCILHWDQKHFVVLYAVKKKGKHRYYRLADPAKGLLTLKEEALRQGWVSSRQEDVELGIALLLEPTPAFESTDEDTTRPQGLRFMLSYVKAYKQQIGQLMAGLLVGSILQLILPFLTQSIVDHGINNNDLSFIHLILVAQLILTLSATSVEFIRGWILLHLGTRMNIALISDFLTKLLRLPMGYFDSKQTGDLMQRISDHHRIESFLTNSSLTTLFSMVNVLVFGMVLLYYDWRIFGVFFGGSLLYVVWVALFMRKRRLLDLRYFEQQSINQSKLIQLVTGMQEIKLHGCEQQKRWEWESVQAKLFRVKTGGMALRQYQDSGAVLINQSKNLLITALAAGFVLKGQMTLGMMLSVQYIIGQLNAPVEQLIQFMRSWQDARLSLERLQEVHQLEEEDKDPHMKTTFTTLHDPIRLENVSFTYNGLTPVLQGIDLTIPVGKQTAIVGMSGSGKTTLIKLLLGYYPPTTGKILINNSPLEHHHKRDWRQHCGIVMQDGLIFSDTVARNIAPGEEHIDLERLRQAAITANIHDHLCALPLGYNTLIGPEGMNLSQGQKQRILIARAVYKNPPLLFLDEATNALDANNERCIMNRLQTFFQGRTVVVVAHRLSTVRQADQIIVIHQGRVAEQGDHASLIARQGAYYQLVKNQLEL